MSYVYLYASELKIDDLSKYVDTISDRALDQGQSRFQKGQQWDKVISFILDKSEHWRCKNIQSWTSPSLLSSVQREEHGEEIVFVSHCIYMVYCFVADVKVSIDNPSHETLAFNKPYGF